MSSTAAPAAERGVREESKPSLRTCWLVFARRRYDEPLYQVGTVTSDHMAHVRNLVSTYLRFSKGERFDVVWRLHQMWYMESMCGRERRLDQLIRSMDEATSSRLQVDDAIAEFAETYGKDSNP